MQSTKNSSGTRRSADASQIGNAPDTAFIKARQEWFERVGGPVVERARWFVIAFLLGLISLALALGYTYVLPLKTVAPFIIEVDKHSGEPKASQLQAITYKPGEREIRYFAVRWLRNLLGIGPSAPDNLQEAYSMARGTAVEVFKEYLNKSRVFAEMKGDPSLRRTIEISSTSFIQERVLLVRLVTTTRSTRRATEEKRFVVNLNFELDPPKEEAQIQANPLGFYVTHFDIQEELK